MNINFGLFPPPAETGKRPLRGAERKRAICRRAMADVEIWLREAGDGPEAPDGGGESPYPPFLPPSAPQAA
jgi:hypothetical protein